MNVSYRGIHKELPSKLQEKVDAKFAKLSKLLERRGEKEAHVVITTERHLHHAEITLQFYDHQLVCMGTDADLFTALSSALEKLEKLAAPHAVIASNTSGLRIADMLAGRSASFKSRFMVTHFFNPPRYMKLLELVAAPDTTADAKASAEAPRVTIGRRDRT